MKWKLKDILMIAIVGVLFSFLFLGANELGVMLTAALTPAGYGPLGYQIIYGAWFMAATFATYIIQKAGVGILAEIIAAALETMMGSMFGPSAILSGLIQGVGCELGFLVTAYKKFNTFTMILSSVFCSVISFIFEYYRFGYGVNTKQMLVLMLLCRTISSVLLTGIASKLLADQLADAGVLRGYKLGIKQSIKKNETKGAA